MLDIVKVTLGAALVLVSMVSSASAQLAPFGQGQKVQKRTAPKPSTTFDNANQPIACFAPAAVGSWMVESPAEGHATPFTIEGTGESAVLSIQADQLTPARSTVRVLLPGDGPSNGDVWAKYRATFVTFECKSTATVPMTFHLLHRGKSAGTYQATFTARAGDWQRVVIPINEFTGGLRSFSRTAGIGFRTVAAQEGTRVQIRNLSVGAAMYTDDAWRAHLHRVSLKGDWHFATDPGDRGRQEQWFADAFDAAAWKTIQSGLSWQEQGVTHHGYGWYRQQLFVPSELKGAPMTLALCRIASDDDVWINGQRVGGWNGEYKYDNHIERIYTVPASLIRYGQNNTIAIRVWGGNLSFIGNKSGLVDGTLQAEFDPYISLARDDAKTEPVPAELFDLSDAQRGKPFELGFAFPAELAEQAAAVEVRVTGATGDDIVSTTVKPVIAPDGVAHVWVALDRDAAHAAYLRGRLRGQISIRNAAGATVYAGVRVIDRVPFTKRDQTSLAPIAERVDDTPYGKLTLIDEIDAATSVIDDDHPYLQSGYDNSQNRMTPGTPVQTHVRDILGQKARESDYGWFAYRIGRGKLKPRATYLLRIEYPEDKPRFYPIEVQTGQNYADVGFKNGVGANDPYDNWPLSGKWEWYDVIVPLDDETVGTGGTGTASASNGLWVYFMNKLKPNAYYSMYSGGPAVGRIRLYEIDPEKHAPTIRLPEGLPHRTFSMDWERQPDHEPADLVRYAKLMGYNAISPVIIKWAFQNYSPPLDGYTTVAIDDHNYWVQQPYDPATRKHALAAMPPRLSVHEKYLQATKAMGLQYIPRIEWGGSMDLPEGARAIDTDGKPMKPNRFAQWCSNLLKPETFDDAAKLIDHLVKPYIADNPQLAGVLWRIRSNRLPISYGQADIELFAAETNTPLPPGGPAQRAAWASGEVKTKYDDWWHAKRAAFHAKLVERLRSHRADLALWYYNWDEDKFGLINPDITAWAFVQTLGNDGRNVYQKEREVRNTFTGADYVSVMRTGNFGDASKGINRADYGIRPALYADIPGFRPFAPANYLCYAREADYLNYFRTADGVAVSNVVSYDEIGSRTINPKYEGNMVTPAGAQFSMALELLAYFNADARTLNYTVYTYGRGFADAHRRFAQAYLALPAIDGVVVDQPDADLKIRTYAGNGATYVGVAYKGYAPKQLTITLPGDLKGKQVIDLVTGDPVTAVESAESLKFQIESNPMTLHAFVVR